jgi:autotransporter strand-loop-strand O-heptosyltransferase
MTSEETKNIYIKEFESTTIDVRQPINRDNFYFNMNFVGKPFFEIKGETDKKFKVSFVNGLNEIVYQTELSTNMWSSVNKTYFDNWKVLVESDGYKNELTYDCTGKRVYISVDSSSLGDSIAWIPYIDEFRKKWNCEVVVSTFWNKLFRKSYPDLQFVEPGEVVHNLYAMYTIGWFWNSDKEPEEPNTIPLQKSASNILGLDFKEIKPNIDFIPGDKPFEGKYVVIAPHSTSGLKYWNNPTGWQETIDYLVENGYKVVNISKDKVDYSNILQLEDTSIENTMNVIHHSEFMIGLSSGLSWLSWAVGKHVIMISNFTTSDHEFQSNCSRLIDYSVCFGCWNKKEYRFDKGDWNWCPVWKGTDRQFECHKKISSQMVINRIKSIDKLSKFEWGWMKDNLNQKEVLIKEIFEDKIYEKFFEIEEGDVVLDIGSSVGPLPYSSGDKIKHVYCLEPSDVEFDTLLKNMENISSTCLKLGISKESGKINGDYIYGGQTEMDCISFKDLINNHNIDKIDFFKTDCEGGEYDVFTLENLDWIKSNVKKITGEWHLSDPNLKDKFKKFRDEFLINFDNYEVYSLDGYNIKWNLFTDQFINYYSEIIIHIKNY